MGSLSRLRQELSPQRTNGTEVCANRKGMSCHSLCMPKVQSLHSGSGRGDNPDHKALETIFKKPLITAPKRLQRMLLQLQKYNLLVIYKPGKRMYIADMLSRAALSPKQDLQDNDNDVLSAELASLNTLEGVRVSDASLRKIAEATRHDADLQQMIDYIRHGWPTSKKQCPDALKHYWTFRDELVQDQGIIMKGPKLLVPAVMRRKVLKKIRYSHVGADSCLRKALDVLFWPGMAKAVHYYISKCAMCNEFQPQQQK